MTDQCKAPEGVARDVSKSGLKDQDKQVAKDLLSDIQVFKLPSSGTGERTPCLPAKQTLDEYQFRGGGEADQFAKILGLPESAAHRPRDITNLVMESTPEYTDHTLKAEVALKAGNPNLKDNEIIGIWLPKKEGASFPPEQASLHPEEDRREVAQMHSYMAMVNKDFERAADLSKMVKADGGKPPTVITPMLINPYHIPLEGVSEEKNPFVITAAELGIDPITPANKDDIRYKDALLSGLHKLADKGDYRAQSVLDSVAAIEKLADTGSKVYLSQTNENKFELTSYLAAFHPNVTSVTSLDRHGEQAFYNKDSGAYAKEKGKGTLIAVPPELDGKLDLADLPNAVLYKPLTDGPLIGADLSKAALSDQQFGALTAEIGKATEVRRLANVDDMLDLGRGQLKYEGELEPFVMSSLTSNWSSIQKIAEQAGEGHGLPSADDAAGKEKYIRDLLQNPALIKKLSKAGDELIEAKLKEAGRDVSAKDDSSADNPLPNDKHFQLTGALLKWEQDLDKNVQTHVFTAAQFEQLVKTSTSSARKPTLDKSDERLYYVPDDLSLTHSSTYLAVRTTDGRTVVLPSDSGNSFAAPYAAGLDEFRAR